MKSSVQKKTMDEKREEQKMKMHEQRPNTEKMNE